MLAAPAPCKPPACSGLTRAGRAHRLFLMNREEKRVPSITRRALLGTAAAALAAPHVRAAEATRVKFASVGGITDAPLFLARELGFFAKAGLDVDMSKLNNAPELMTATATSQLDASGISTTPGLFASVQRGLALRLVGDKQSLRRGFSATRLVLRSALVQGDEAANVALLRGRSVAVSARASCVYMLLENLLAKHGMKLAELNVIELAYPNMIPAFVSGAIDAAIDLEPFMTQAIHAGLARDICDFTEFVPEQGGSIVPIVYSENFAANGQKPHDFMRAYMQGVRVYNDAFAKGIDRERVIDIIARLAGVERSVVADGFPAGLDPNQALNRDFIDRTQRFFVAQNFLRAPVDMDRMIDNSFAESAVQALGRYS